MPKQTRHLNKTPQVLRGELPPREKILELARGCKFVERLRKLDPALLLYTLIFGVSDHKNPIFSEIHRKYKAMDDSRDENDKIRQQSLSKRMDETMVKFLSQVFLACIDHISSTCPAELRDHYKAFKTIYILDSTIIRLHAKLAALYPSTRSRIAAGGMKISLLFNAVSHGPEMITIVSERVHDIKALKIGPWIKDCLILMDLGYYSHWNLIKIIEYGGSFVIRVKKNTKPTVISVFFSSCADIFPVLGSITLWEYLDSIPQKGIIDLFVQIGFKRRKYRNKQRRDAKMIRVVCFWNEEKAMWHTYMTNLSVQSFSAEEIYLLYRFRWEIEMIFKELKSDFELGKLRSSRDPVVLVNVYASLIRLTISHQLYKNMVRAEEIESEREKFSPKMWSTVLVENLAVFFHLIHDELFCSSDVQERVENLFRTLRYQSKRIGPTDSTRSIIVSS
ncbi:MAG: IS4 family transposase [Methanoregula sp.]|nr:IS4 family transposase [Methanoregula sp.]